MRSPPPKKPMDSGADDAVIAQALWRSLAVLLALGALAGGAIGWLARRPAAPPTRMTPLASPRPAAPDDRARAPRVRFVDVTRAAGIDFTHENGARGAKYLPETMGGGVALFDADADGDADILFVNGCPWDADGHPSRSGPTPRLYRNDTAPGGPLHFTDISPGSGLDVVLQGMGAAVGDYDNDGRVDVLLTGVGGARLFRNQSDGRFLEVTAATGLGGWESDWSTAAAWFDADNDGDLDLFVGNYVGWSPEIDQQVNNQLVGVGRAYGRPWNYPGTLPRFFRNHGGRFTEEAEAAGFHVRNPSTDLPMAKTLAVAPVDLDGDGWMDLVVANDTVRNFVFVNRGNGTFREVGVETGIAYDTYGQARGAMGIDAARFRNDDDLGIAIGNFANEMNALYVSQGSRESLVFADAAIAEGLGPASQLLLKFGLFFFDYDLDGRLDVLTANGHIEADIEKVQAAVRYRQPAQLFWNAGGSQTFVSVGPEQCGPDLFQPIVGRGSAFADLDDDGDLDVVLTQVGGPPVVLRNEPSGKPHWLRLRLVGTTSNRDAIGAWIRVRTGAGIQARQVMPTRSYLSQSELPVTIGLGSTDRVDSLEIRWPSGRTQSLKPSGVDRTLTVAEPR